LSIGGNLPPVYQNPVSLQYATVDQSFNYIMPDNAFVDPNADVMSYKAEDLPKWLSFDASKRAFSGKPTSGDTGTFTDQSTIITISASDGRQESQGQMTVAVAGESYLAKVIKVVGPTLSGLGMMYSGYKNRALFLDVIAKKKWKNNQISVQLGEPFIYQLKTSVKDIQKIQTYVIDKGMLGKIAKKVLCGKERYIPFALNFPIWMGYNSQTNTLYSTRALEEIDLMGHRNMQVRVLGSGAVIKEILHLTLTGDAPTLNGTFNSLTIMEQERIGLLLFPGVTTNSIKMDSLVNEQLV